MARLDYLYAQARSADPDRYLCALFAPVERREAVLALLLLNRELARVPALVSQPVAGLIRYQWWREAIGEAAAGQARDQPVVEALANGLTAGWLDPAGLHALVDGREAEIEGPAPSDLASLETRLDATEGATQELTLACLGGEGLERRAARLVGTALGLAAVDGRDAGKIMDPATARRRVAELLAEARRLAPRPPAGRMAAFLPARLALRRLSRSVGRRGAAGGVRQPASTVVRVALAYLRRRY